MAEQINLASLIISIIILIVVVILIFMVCYYYYSTNNNNNSTKSIQNPQALAAAALYKNANKDNFGDAHSSGCGSDRGGDCCVATNAQAGRPGWNAGTCSIWGGRCSTNEGNGGNSCSDW